MSAIFPFYKISEGFLLCHIATSMSSTWDTVDNDKYIYRACSGNSRLATTKPVAFPGRKFENKGDTLEIKVDENKKVSIKINDRDYGIVPGFLLKPEKYRLAVHVCAPSCEMEFY